MSDPITAVLGFLSSPVTSWIESRAKQKYLKAEGALEIAKAEVKLKVSKMESEAERLLRNDLVDADYDTRAQEEKRHTIADELLIAWTLIVVSLHFYMPAEMQAGWEAMGYAKPPWWMEFIIVGIFISVFGLMRLFRAWRPFSPKEPKLTKVPEETK